MTLNSLFFNIAYMDAPLKWQWGFQDPATSTMQAIIDVHHDIMCILMFILVFVSWILCRALWFFKKNSNESSSYFSHGTTIEIFWTLFPSVILMIIALPSFALLYSMDEIVDPSLTLKVIGHQWYWTYEYSDYCLKNLAPLKFESYMISEDLLEMGQPRLLEVDNRVVLPINTTVRALITSADVLHSWAVPSLGIKCDAIPGRLNQVFFSIFREGVFYGQCSELCGVNHGFMPIVIESVSLANYTDWITEKFMNL